MKLYYYFYCKAFNWYNTTGKKDKDSLRFSAIVLISAIQIINIICISFVISVLLDINLVKAWFFVIGYVSLVVANFRVITSEKSDIIREQIQNLDSEEAGRLKTLNIIYIVGSVLLFSSILGIQIYLKAHYGVWLLHGYKI